MSGGRPGGQLDGIDADSGSTPTIGHFCWSTFHGTQRRRTPLRERWCVADASEKDWENFAAECDVRMSNFFEDGTFNLNNSLKLYYCLASSGDDAFCSV